MNDSISRQAAIDALCKWKSELTWDSWCEQHKDEPERYNILAPSMVVKELPSAQPNIIRCKDCKYRQTDDCPMYYEEWIEIDEGDGYFDTDNIIHDRTTDEGFCHHAELRGEEE